MTTEAGYRLISADSHVVEPPDVFAELPAGVRDRAPKLADFEGGSAWFVDGVEPVPLAPSLVTGSGLRRPSAKVASFDAVLPGLHDPAERIKAQDADSVDAEFLYPTPGLWDALEVTDDDELKLACAKAYNDWLSAFCAHAPDRLFGIAKIPTTSVEAAVAEVQRAVGELGMKGVLLDAFPSGATIGGRPEDEPFWEAVNELKVPVSFHYGVGVQSVTEPPRGVAPGLKPPMADAILPLVAGGVFDRNPDVRIVLAHGDAGWALHWMETFDILHVRQGHLAHFSLQEEGSVPSDYFRKFGWFTFHHDRTAVKSRSKIGPAHLMWASHFPHDDANWPDDRQQAMNVTAELPDADAQALLAGNVARLYRLPGYEKGFSDDEITDFEKLVHF
jgi:predicted TIM-barrel fold metal-dependent hydrolase